MRIFLDFETRSEVDLKKAGAARYAANLDRLLCMAYQIDDQRVKAWTHGEPLPADLFDAIAAGAEVHAWNAWFEQCVWEHHCVPKLRWPAVGRRQWICSMAAAAALGLPLSLGEAGRALGLKQLKDKEGAALMRKMCKPQRSPQKTFWRDSVDDLTRLVDYCKQDVVAERAIDEAIWPLSREEQEVWWLDQEINHRGVCVDLELAQGAINAIRPAIASMDSKMNAITDGEVSACSQVAALTAWLQRRGLQTEGITKDTFDLLILQAKDLKDSVAEETLKLRRAAARTSTAKYQAILNAVSDDGRLRGCHQYHGAATGRFAGRLVQLQNLPRGNMSQFEVDCCVEMITSGEIDDLTWWYGHPMGVLASMVRSAIKAAAGHKLLVADFAAVEARGLAWLAGQDDVLEQFASGDDVYKHMASKIYGLDVSEIDKTGNERQLGKACILGAGYQMGASRFKQTAENAPYFVQGMTDEFAVEVIRIYRESNQRIVQWWDDLNHASREVVTGMNQGVAVEKTVSRVRFFARSPKWLGCELPSGRCLWYYKPEVRARVTEDGYTIRGVEYQGRMPNGRLGTKHLYGGKLAENITQAVCRDLLVAAMQRLEAAGMPVVLHVHDEVVCEVPIIGPSIEDALEVMRAVPDWAEGFPVNAEGFEAERYRK